MFYTVPVVALSHCVQKTEGKQRTPQKKHGNTKPPLARSTMEGKISSKQDLDLMNLKTINAGKHMEEAWMKVYNYV